MGTPTKRLTYGSIQQDLRTLADLKTTLDKTLTEKKDRLKGVELAIADSRENILALQTECLIVLLEEFKAVTNNLAMYESQVAALRAECATLKSRLQTMAQTETALQQMLEGQFGKVVDFCGKKR